MNRLETFLVIFVFILSFILRIHNYSVYPQRGATSDEYTYAFLGVSLLTKHVPISWSSFAPYKNRQDLTINHIYFPIVYPYFDHPPLYGLLVGGWALLNGENTFQKIELSVIRIIPVALSLISSFILFIIALRLFGFQVALWSLLLFNTITLFVMNTRVSVSENLLTLFFLLSLYLLSSKKFTDKKAVLLGVLCGLSLITKAVGVSIFLVSLFFFVKEKFKTKHVFIVSLFFVASIATLLIYAAYFNWTLFWEVQRSQGSRWIGPETLLNLTQNPVIVNKIVVDGWYLFGFLALFVSFFSYKKLKYIVVPAFFYFMVLLISLTREGSSGWYLIPLFPFMSLSIAYVLKRALEEYQLFFFVFLLFVGMHEVHFLYEEPFGLTSFSFRMIIFLMFFPLLAVFALGKEQLFRRIGTAWFYLFIVGNIILTLTYVHPS